MSFCAGTASSSAFDFDDGEYLLTEVYQQYDSSGALSVEARGPPMDKESLNQTPAQYARALLDANLSLAGAATRGDLLSVHEALLELRGSELLPAALDEALEGATCAGHVRVSEYLVRRGLEPKRETLCFLVIDAAVDAAIEKEAESATTTTSTATSVSASEFLEKERFFLNNDGCALLKAITCGSSDDDTLHHLSSAASLLWCVARCGCDANGARTSDFYSPLHLTALHGLVRESLALLLLGADPNAVARDDSTPLGSLRSGRADALSSKDIGALLQVDALEKALLEAGAVDGLTARLARRETAAQALGVTTQPEWLEALTVYGGALAAMGVEERAPRVVVQKKAVAAEEEVGGDIGSVRA